MGVPSLIFFWSADLSPFFCACRALVFFLYFPFFDVFIPFPGISAHTKQTKIVLLQCAVIFSCSILVLLIDVQPGLCTSTSYDANHTMIGTFPLSASVPSNFQIATVLILEYTTILFASPSRPSRVEALDKACSQFICSNTYSAVNQLFLLSPKLYSTQQFTEFLLMHRLR